MFFLIIALNDMMHKYVQKACIVPYRFVVCVWFEMEEYFLISGEIGDLSTYY